MKAQNVQIEYNILRMCAIQQLKLEKKILC